MARDPEFWQPSGRKRIGRPPGRKTTAVYRSHDDFPPPTPQDTLCRLWQGAVDRDGYGVRTTHHDNRKRYVHRWVWEAVHGPIPPGMVVRHKCDNRVCYRLAHLELGTVADNNRDAQERGHLGPPRALTPSEVVAIQERHDAGESYATIHRDYPHASLATIKLTRKYIDEARDLVRSRAVHDGDAEEPTRYAGA